MNYSMHEEGPKPITPKRDADLVSLNDDVHSAVERVAGDIFHDPEDAMGQAVSYDANDFDITSRDDGYGDVLGGIADIRRYVGPGPFSETYLEVSTRERGTTDNELSVNLHLGEGKETLLLTPRGRRLDEEHGQILRRAVDDHVEPIVRQVA